MCVVLLRQGSVNDVVEVAPLPTGPDILAVLAHPHQVKLQFRVEQAADIYIALEQCPVW